MASLFKCVLSSRAFTIENNVKILNEVKAYRAFSLCWWPASMQIYWNVKKVFAVEKSSTPTGLVGAPTLPPFIVLGRHQYGCCDIM